MNAVLLVDDSPALRAIYARVLQATDLPIGEFMEAGSAREALATMQRRHDVALVVTDVGMPGTDGVELVRALRERCAKDELAILVVTTERDARRAEEALAIGADGVVQKPFEPGDVERALAGRLAPSR